MEDSSISESKSQKSLTGQFRIGGMTCAACVNSVECILKKLPGVKRAVVALATSLGEVEYDPSITTKDEIIVAVEDAGFEASLIQSNEHNKVLLAINGLLIDIDFHLLESILKDVRGVRDFSINKITAELQIIFDPEVAGLRSIVDSIETKSNGNIKLKVQNSYARAASNDAGQSAKMLRLFISSLLLSVSTVCEEFNISYDISDLVFISDIFFIPFLLAIDPRFSIKSSLPKNPHSIFFTTDAMRAHSIWRLDEVGFGQCHSILYWEAILHCSL